MTVATVVLVPGLMCDQAIWAAQVDALGRQGVRLAVADHAVARSLQQMARAILDSNVGPLIAVGHSMGGRVVMEMARLQPQRLRAVALLDTGYQALAGGEHGERERSGRLALVELARREGMRAMATAWVQNMVHPERLRDVALIDAILEMFGRRTLAQFEAQQQALLERPDATGVLTSLHCPTLLACGEQDQWSPPAQHREMQRLIAGSRISIVSECGHMAPMERPAEVNQLLSDWLRTSCLSP